MRQIDNITLSIDLAVCTWLQYLCIENSAIQHVPSSITLLTDLVELELNANRLTSIDSIDFVRMSKLSSLDVSSLFVLQVFSRLILMFFFASFVTTNLVLH
jgi:Leucine-rich repeat (LRR) protein